MKQKYTLLCHLSVAASIDKEGRLFFPFDMVLILQLAAQAVELGLVELVRMFVQILKHRKIFMVEAWELVSLDLRG